MKYAIKNVKILDGGESGEIISGKAILVVDGKISDIVAENEIPADFDIKDMGGNYLLPGLINLHVHIPSSGKPTKKKTDYEKVAKLLRFGVARAVVRAMCESYAKQQLLSGTTTIRAVGGVLDFDTKLRDKINAGKAVGPRILAANCAVSVPGGHMTGSVALPAHSEEEAVQMVIDRAAEKPDLIKLMITGGVLDADIPGEPGVLKMPESYAAAATKKAHELGLKVAAHVESTEGMLVALRSGVDTLEHGGKPSDEVIDLFKKTGSVLVATLSPAVPFAVMDPAVTGFGETDLINGKALFENMKNCVNACLKNGVTVGLGTDTGCPFTTQYDMWRELWYFCKCCGVTPAFAIHTATQINAKIAEIDDITGAVKKGLSADFMVVKENPLENLKALRAPEYVVFKGEILEHPQPSKFKNVEAELDKVMKEF